jgi:hypothetical protein
MELLKTDFSNTLNTEDKIISVIIETNKALYVPIDVTLRCRISDYIFTADIFQKSIEALRLDSCIDVIEESQPLYLMKS